MYEYNEFEKCRFCTHHNSFEGCGHPCDDYDGFKPDNERIIRKAKERGLSVTDVAALINLNASNDYKEYINVKKLLKKVDAMAKRGTLLARGGVIQEDLAMQIKGLIVHVASEDDMVYNETK